MIPGSAVNVSGGADTPRYRVSGSSCGRRPEAAYAAYTATCAAAEAADTYGTEQNKRKAYRGHEQAYANTVEAPNRVCSARATRGGRSGRNMGPVKKKKKKKYLKI